MHKLSGLLDSTTTDNALKDFFAHLSAGAYYRQLALPLIGDLLKRPPVCGPAVRAGRLIRSTLGKLRPIGPYRRWPERFYFFPETPPMYVGYYGEDAPHVLGRQRKLEQLTDKWLQQLDLGYALRIRRFESTDESPMPSGIPFQLLFRDNRRAESAEFPLSRRWVWRKPALADHRPEPFWKDSDNHYRAARASHPPTTAGRTGGTSNSRNTTFQAESLHHRDAQRASYTSPLASNSGNERWRTSRWAPRFKAQSGCDNLCRTWQEWQPSASSADRRNR